MTAGDGGAPHPGLPARPVPSVVVDDGAGRSRVAGAVLSDPRSPMPTTDPAPATPVPMPWCTGSGAPFPDHHPLDYLWVCPVCGSPREPVIPVSGPHAGHRVASSHLDVRVALPFAASVAEGLAALCNQIATDQGPQSPASPLPASIAAGMAESLAAYLALRWGTTP